MGAVVRVSAELAVAVDEETAEPVAVGGVAVVTAATQKMPAGRTTASRRASRRACHDV